MRAGGEPKVDAVEEVFDDRPECGRDLGVVLAGDFSPPDLVGDGLEHPGEGHCVQSGDMWWGFVDWFGDDGGEGVGQSVGQRCCGRPAVPDDAVPSAVGDSSELLDVDVNEIARVCGLVVDWFRSPYGQSGCRSRCACSGIRYRSRIRPTAERGMPRW